MKKQVVSTIVIAIVVGLGGFYGGMLYGKKQALTPAGLAGLSQTQRQQLFTGARGSAGASGARRGSFGGNGGGFTSGSIISKDDKSITVKGMDGSSHIIFVASSTTVSKSVDGAISDLSVGNNVIVNGSGNSDGSLTAQNIQIRPDQPAQTK